MSRGFRKKVKERARDLTKRRRCDIICVHQAVFRAFHFGWSVSGAANCAPYRSAYRRWSFSGSSCFSTRRKGDVRRNSLTPHLWVRFPTGSTPVLGCKCELPIHINEIKFIMEKCSVPRSLRQAVMSGTAAACRGKIPRGNVCRHFPRAFERL